MWITIVDLAGGAAGGVNGHTSGSRENHSSHNTVSAPGFRCRRPAKSRRTAIAECGAASTAITLV